MKIAKASIFIRAVLVAVGTSGCTDDGEKDEMSSELSWRAAKTHAQQMELEIAALIPEKIIVSIDQAPTGVMLSCDATQHNWNGQTTVTVKPKTEIEPVVRDIQTHYESQNENFRIRSRYGVTGLYKLQLIAPAKGESYLIGEGLEPDQIRIASGSPCFTLPEGVYPGGEF